MGSTRYDARWYIADGLEFIRGLTHSLEIRGFAVGLTGSVLTKSESMHDLDIIVYPLQSTSASDFEDARNALKAKGGVRVLDSNSLKRVWRKKGSQDEKTVEVWHFDEKRVDVFFLR